MVACGGNDDNSDKKPDTPPAPVVTVPNYYLAGEGSVFTATASGEGTEAVGGKWYAGYKDVKDVPASILFTAVKDKDKEYTLTVELEENDEFGIVIVGKSWAGQMGYSIVAEQEEENLVEGGGYDTKNIKIAFAGEYTFTLNMSGANPVLTYELAKAPIAVSGVTLNKPTLALTVGGTETLEATVTPDDAADKTVTWTSSDEEVAKVDATGKVTAVAAGTAKITATAGEKTAECAVTVIAAGEEIVDVTGVTLNKTTATLHVGGEDTLTATVAPENATNATVTYTSSAPTIVSVGTDGKITALKSGTATITAQAGEKTAECVVTVAKDYYLVGSLNDWSTVDALGQADVIYFTEDETTAGVYKATEVVLNKGTEFQIVIVNNAYVDAVTNSALPTEGATLTYLAAKGDSNIEVKTSGKYTITLDTTGDKPVVTVVQDEDLPDNITEATKLRVYGDSTEWTWTDPETGMVRPTVDFEQNETTGKWTATLSNVTLTEGELQLRWGTNFSDVVYCDYGMGADKFTIPTVEDSPAMEKAATSNNIKVNAAGTYNITVTLTATGDVESIVIVVAPAAAE